MRPQAPQYSDAFRACRYCHGRGCLACQQEAARAYEKEFPEGPKPLVSIALDDAEGMEALAQILSPEGLNLAAAEAKEKLDGGSGLMAALRRIGDPAFNAATEHDATVELITNKLAALRSTPEKAAPEPEAAPAPAKSTRRKRKP